MDLRLSLIPARSCYIEMMLIDVVRPESWDELNDRVKAVLNVSDKMRVRCFHDLAQAAFEISQATAHFLAHKKSVGFITGQTPFIEPLLPYYYKETYDVQKQSHLQLSSVSAWVNELKKDTGFVVFAEDHPVTGEKYSFADELDRLLNEKRIFSVRISHAQHLYQRAELRPYSVRLCSFGANAAVAITGERFRSPSLLAHTMNWDERAYIDSLERTRCKRTENRGLINEFETAVASVARPFFSPGQERLFDRAVCVFGDVSADAVRTEVLRKLGLKPDDSHIETTNMCSWSSVTMFNKWWEPAPSPQSLRGVLVVSCDLLNVKDFAKLVISSYEEIKAQQSWEI